MIKIFRKESEVSEVRTTRCRPISRWNSAASDGDVKKLGRTLSTILVTKHRHIQSKVTGAWHTKVRVGMHPTYYLQQYVKMIINKFYQLASTLCQIYYYLKKKFPISKHPDCSKMCNYFTG